MSQPVAYNRQFNFSNYQAVSPSQPLPAAQVDLELNSVKATLDQVLNNLALIQRDDTALANASVGIDQLKAEVSIGINPPMPWVTAHSYVARDTVTIGAVFYICVTSHTSGVFATDLGSGLWSVIADFTAVTFDLATAIHAATGKTTPNDSDEVPLSDSAAAFGLKKFSWSNIKTTLYAALGGLIGSGSGKTTPVDADALAIMDSAAGNATKTLTIANLKAALWVAIGPAIAALTGKATPVGADSIVVSDSAAAGASKSVTLTNLFAAIFAAWGGLINSATGKSTPIDADMVEIVDTAAGNALKKLTFTQMWVNYFKGKADALYQALDATLTSLAAISGVAGDIIYASGADAWARLAKGSDGQVLTLASGLPIWAAVPSSMTLLGTLNTTSGATQSLTGLTLTSYKYLLCVVKGVSQDSTGTLQLALGSGGTPTYGTAVSLTAAGTAASTFEGAVLIYGINNTVQRQVVLAPINNAGAVLTTLPGVLVAAATGTAAVCNAVRFLASAGSFDAGSIDIYGVS